MSDAAQLSLAGQTMQWKFDSGPTAGATYEHTFNTDGTVQFKQLGAKADATAQAHTNGEKKPAPKAAPTRYASFELAEGIHLVSYRSEMGWTLTVAVNVENETLHGFASNDKEWYPVTGTLVA